MTRLKELTEEQEKKVRAKINRLLDEKNYPEAAKLMVAMAVSKIDPDKFAHDLIDCPCDDCVKRRHICYGCKEYDDWMDKSLKESVEDVKV